MNAIDKYHTVTAWTYLKVDRYISEGAAKPVKAYVRKMFSCGAIAEIEQEADYVLKLLLAKYRNIVMPWYEWGTPSKEAVLRAWSPLIRLSGTFFEHHDYSVYVEPPAPHVHGSQLGINHLIDCMLLGAADCVPFRTFWYYDSGRQAIGIDNPDGKICEMVKLDESLRNKADVLIGGAQLLTKRILLPVHSVVPTARAFAHIMGGMK